eukprot:Awhi_evm1s5681
MFTATTNKKSTKGSRDSSSDNPKPFLCEFENCVRRYISAHSRRQHYRRHHFGQLLPGKKRPCGTLKHRKKADKILEDCLEQEKDILSPTLSLQSLNQEQEFNNQEEQIEDKIQMQRRGSELELEIKTQTQEDLQTINLVKENLLKFYPTEKDSKTLLLAEQESDQQMAQEILKEKLKTEELKLVLEKEKQKAELIRQQQAAQLNSIGYNYYVNTIDYNSPFSRLSPPPLSFSTAYPTANFYNETQQQQQQRLQIQQLQQLQQQQQQQQVGYL